MILSKILLKQLRLRNMALLFFLFGLYFSNNMFAQETKPIAQKNAISFNIMGASPALGITYQRAIIPQLEAEIGIGFGGFGGGIKYYPFKVKERRLNPLIGIIYSTITDFVGPANVFDNQFLYMPLGANFCGGRGFNFGFDFGGAIHFINKVNAPDPAPIYFASIKFGFRFGKKN